MARDTLAGIDQVFSPRPGTKVRERTFIEPMPRKVGQGTTRVPCVSSLTSAKFRVVRCLSAAELLGRSAPRFTRKCRSRSLFPTRLRPPLGAVRCNRLSSYHPTAEGD
jgi:hypothetical protein